MENKVAKKAIITIDLLKLVHLDDIIALDIKDFLFKEFILKEKEFKASLKSFNFEQFRNKLVYLHCSNNAIVPMWAYMQISSYLTKENITHCFATNYDEAVELFILKAIDKIDIQAYQDKRVVIKGCGGKLNLSPSCYISITEKLTKVARAISYGEACSMVPVTKK